MALDEPSSISSRAPRLFGSCHLDEAYLDGVHGHHVTESYPPWDLLPQFTAAGGALAPTNRQWHQQSERRFYGSIVTRLRFIAA